ncbi:MAG: zinc ribbon domain-containing protein [Pseudomonadales bacterium]
MKSCPECLSEIPSDAQVCAVCTERIEGQRCPRCASMCRAEAEACKWCGHEFQQTRQQVELEPFTIKAEQLPTLLLRFRLLPQEMHFSTDKITVSTPGLFRLWVREEEIPWHKVAGFKYRDGIFWDTVHIETRGQSASEVGGLRKHDGNVVRDILQQLEQ